MNDEEEKKVIDELNDLLAQSKALRSSAETMISELEGRPKSPETEELIKNVKRILG